MGTITTKGLTKKFGKLTAVDDLDLDIENSVTVVEWGGAESARLSEDRLEISIDRTNEIRQVEIKAIGARWNGFAL